MSPTISDDDLNAFINYQLGINLEPGVRSHPLAVATRYSCGLALAHLDGQPSDLFSALIECPNPDLAALALTAICVRAELVADGQHRRDKAFRGTGSAAWFRLCDRHKRARQALVEFLDEQEIQGSIRSVAKRAAEGEIRLDELPSFVEHHTALVQQAQKPHEREVRTRESSKKARQIKSAQNSAEPIPDEPEEREGRRSDPATPLEVIYSESWNEISILEAYVDLSESERQRLFLQILHEARGAPVAWRSIAAKFKEMGADEIYDKQQLHDLRKHLLIKIERESTPETRNVFGRGIRSKRLKWILDPTVLNFIPRKT